MSPDHSKTLTRVARGIAAVIGVILIFTAITQVSWFWPHTSISQPSPLISQEYTSDGVPVFRSGDVIRYTTSFDNEGVAITATRWLDSYSNVKNIYKIMEDAQSETLLRVKVFPSTDKRASVNAPVSVELDGPIDVPGYYRLRTLNQYKANPFHQHTNETITGLFYLANTGALVP